MQCCIWLLPFIRNVVRDLPEYTASHLRHTAVIIEHRQQELSAVSLQLSVQVPWGISTGSHMNRVANQKKRTMLFSYLCHSNWTSSIFYNLDSLFGFLSLFRSFPCLPLFYIRMFSSVSLRTHRNWLTDKLLLLIVMIAWNTYIYSVRRI
jgi:hypothetical protein